MVVKLGVKNGKGKRNNKMSIIHIVNLILNISEKK